MKSYIVVGFLILLAFYAFYLGWMNHASEKIISTLIPIAIAAMVGVFLAVLAFLGKNTQFELATSDFTLNGS